MSVLERRPTLAPTHAAVATPVLDRPPTYAPRHAAVAIPVLERPRSEAPRHAAVATPVLERTRAHMPRHAAVIDRVDITLIVPTRNEAGNIHTLIGAVTSSLQPSLYSWQLIFVDDSDDNTPELIASASESRPEISLIHREPSQRKGGLASAVTAGYAAARGDALVVMDGDLQHPPELIRGLAAPILAGDADLVIASRYVTGASAEGLDNRRRRLVSTMCTKAVHLLVPASRAVQDPLSGFFAVGRKALEEVELHPHGFKILLEVLARAKPPRVMEVPFIMRQREEGTSKAGMREGFRFALHLGRIASPTETTFRHLGRLILLQIPLVVILAMQVWMSEKLIYRNTAFIDEGTYLSAGHYELYAMSHPGAPNMHLATYFSGAPTIYPILAAWANNLDGLAGARYMSMGFMLISTLALYGCAKTLWGRPAGWLAAGVWVTTQGVQFLGSFATYDAMALMLITIAAWWVIRTASRPRVSSLIYLAAPVMVLANATKYATALYDPAIIALAFFTLAYFHTWRSARHYAVTLTAFLILGITAALALAPIDYLAGITSTTLNRHPSSATASTVMHTSWSWIGVIGVLAAVSAALALASVPLIRRYNPDRRQSAALVGILVLGAITVWLAPINQARIHTETSLSKHVTFGAWFGALAAGWLISVVWTDRYGRPRWWRYPLCALALFGAALALVPAGVAGTRQADRQDDWSNSTIIVDALRPLVAHVHSPVLMDISEIPAYYFENQLELPFWVNTFYYAYTPPGSNTKLVGPPAYTAAVDNRVFSVIALDYGSNTYSVDHAVADAIHDSGLYSWVGNFTTPTDYGRATYVVWKRKT